MSSDSDDNETGYGKPPKRAQWKEGQSGNPKRRYPKGTSGNRGRRYRKRTEGRLQMMTRLLLRRVEITVSDETKKVTVLEAILLQLEHSDAPAAAKIRLKYEAWARQNSEPKTRTVFVDSDYTRALAGTKKGDGDE